MLKMQNECVSLTAHSMWSCETINVDLILNQRFYSLSSFLWSLNIKNFAMCLS